MSFFISIFSHGNFCTNLTAFSSCNNADHFFKWSFRFNEKILQNMTMLSLSISVLFSDLKTNKHLPQFVFIPFFYFPNNISVLNVTRLFNILSAFFEEFSPPLVLPSFLQPLLISSWSRPNMRRRRTQCRVTRGVHRIKIRALRSDKRSLSYYCY